MQKTNLFVVFLAVGLLLTACSSANATSTGMAAPNSAASGESASAEEVDAETTVSEESRLAPDAFTIALEPIGHWHVLASKTLLFTVAETESEEAVEELDLVVQIARPESDGVSERSVADEQVVDEGDGIYSLEYTPSSLGGYGLVARFEHEGQEFVSEPVSFEVAKGGEEGIRVETDDNTYVYQIRYHWQPGHAHANDAEPVKLVFEIMRGIQEGEVINWEQPWQNAFDHITDAEMPSVQVTATDGSMTANLQPVYKGRGIHEAERVFSAGEVGEGADYDVRFIFTDPHNEAEVTHSEPYPLHVSSPH